MLAMPGFLSFLVKSKSNDVVNKEIIKVEGHDINVFTSHDQHLTLMNEIKIGIEVIIILVVIICLFYIIRNLYKKYKTNKLRKQEILKRQLQSHLQSKLCTEVTGV